MTYLTPDQQPVAGQPWPDQSAPFPEPQQPWYGQDPSFTVPAALPPTPGRKAVRRRRAPIVIGASVAVLAGLAGGGSYAYNSLNGGGDQPEQHLPANAMLMMKIDLNPTLAQKVDLLRFAAKFPVTDAGSTDDPRKAAWSGLTSDVAGAPEWKDVEPWIGDRAALALLPGAGTDTPVPVLVLAVSDEDKAAAALGRIKDAAVATGDGWAYLSKDAAHARSALQASRTGNLTTNKTFTADLAALGDRGVADLWLDGGRLRPALAALAKTEQGKGSAAGTALGLGSGGNLPKLGHGALALRLSGPNLEISGNFTGVDPNSTLPAGPSGTATLPDTTLAAFGMTGLGDLLVRNWDTERRQLASSIGVDPVPGFARLGLELPADLKLLLGRSTAVAVGAPDKAGTPSVAVRVSTAGSSAAAVKKLNTVNKTLRTGLQTRPTADGFVVAQTSAQADAAARNSGLGATRRFRNAVPDAGTANLIGYADVRGLMKAYGQRLGDVDRKNLQALDAVGLSVSYGGNGSVSLRLRVTTR